MLFSCLSRFIIVFSWISISKKDFSKQYNERILIWNSALKKYLWFLQSLGNFSKNNSFLCESWMFKKRPCWVEEFGKLILLRHSISTLSCYKHVKNRLFLSIYYFVKKNARFSTVFWQSPSFLPKCLLSLKKFLPKTLLANHSLLRPLLSHFLIDFFLN